MKVFNFVIGICCFVVCLSVCSASNAGNAETSLIEVSGPVQWPEADALFKKNAHWRGSDDAYSIKLGNNRVLWLFGDTLISSKDKIVPRSPDHIKMPRNTVGIQTGLNPATATIKYYWNVNNDSINQQSFFSSPYIVEENWLWPGDCAMLPDGKTLVIFFMNIMPTTTGLHFDISGYQVAIINNTYESPDYWNIKWVKHVSDYSKLKILLGSGGVLIEGDYLYAYGFSSNKAIGGITLARWPLEEFQKNNPNLSKPLWWTGDATGWIKENQLKDINPAVLWDKQQTEFTVNKIEPELYVMVQAYPQNGFMGNANMVYRVSSSLTGPWSEPQTVLYEKLCRDNPAPKDLMVYAGKYHPELTGADLIFTYATNTQDIDTLWPWPNIYYPRFLKMDGKSSIEKIKQKKNEISPKDL